MTDNLPSNQTASRHLSPERVAHREWIGGRALTLLSHYWRDDDPVELTAAIGRDWADVLEGIPQEYVQRACLEYMRTEPRKKPTPGEIYQRAIAAMPKPRAVPQPEPERPARVSAEAANEILAKAGYSVKRIEGCQ